MGIRLVMWGVLKYKFTPLPQVILFAASMMIVVWVNYNEERLISSHYEG